MKQILLIFTFILCCVSVSVAQHTLQSLLNVPRPSDELIKYQVGYKDPGRSGENVLWDFSLLKEENDSYTLKYSEGVDSAIVGTEHRTMYYYALSNDSLLCYGYENQTTLMRHKQPELLLRFPVKYQDKSNSYYYGSGKYCDRLDLSVMGTVETHADAYGMMLLPNGDTLRNVFRVRMEKLIAEGTKPHVPLYEKQELAQTVSPDSIDYRLANDSIVFGVETYRWYAKGYRYPVFETVKSAVHKKGSERQYFDVAFFFPPQDHYYLEEDEANLAELEEMKNEGNNLNNDPWYGLTYNFHPNPVVSNLEVEMYLPRAALVRIQVTERGGRVIMEERWGPKPDGVFSQQVYMSHIPTGEYVLNIWLDDSYMVSGIVFKR